jgi:hypothetical protein
VTIFTLTTTFKTSDWGSCLFVVNYDFSIFSRGKELRTVIAIVTCIPLIELIIDGMEQFSRSDVPVLEHSIGIGRDDNILGDGSTGCRPPSNASGWHSLLILHVSVQQI